MNDLLICAKAVGYSIVENAAGGWSVTRNEGSGCWEYNPRTNDAQAMELLKWMLTRNMNKYGHIALERFGETDFYLSAADINNDRWAFRGKGRTLNEAIIKAVVAMEGEG